MTRDGRARSAGAFAAGALLVAAGVAACAATPRSGAGRGAVAGASPAAPAAAAAAGPTAAADSAAAFPRIAILAYHDVSEDPGAPLQTVSPDFLREQIRACRAEGWTFLALSELLAGRSRPQDLPPRIMVLTFDDGYRSFAERALPILREERVPATLAIVSSFADHPPPGLPPLLTWAELRRVARDPLVEIASHSHALHRYEPSNPFGDTRQSVATRRYLPEARRYEDREEYRSRVGDDLGAARRVLAERLGRAPDVLAWPYGLHNEMARGLAARAGFSATLALGDRAVGPADLAAGCLPRVHVVRTMRFGDGPRAWLEPPPAPVRAAEVDLDALWDPDEAVFRTRLDQAVTRARALGATHVVLPVFPDPRGDGRLSRAWAMNHQAPVLADVWSMAAARFAASRLRVWARVPTLNLTWAWDRHPEWRVGARDARGTRWGTRLSPDLPGARQAAVDFLTDLAVYLPLDGVLFDDDATLREGERLVLDGSRDPAAKAAAIDGLLEACRAAVRAWRPECRFARVVPAEALERTGVHPGLAVDIAEAVRGDDLVVVALPARSRPSPAAAGRLARRAVERWRAAAGQEPFRGTARARDAAPPVPNVLVMLPAWDRSRREWIASRVQQAMADAAHAAGVFHLGSAPIAAAGEVPIGLLDRRPDADGLPAGHGY